MYAANLSTLLYAAIAINLLWTVLFCVVQKGGRKMNVLWKAIHGVAFAVAVYGVLLYTVLGRHPSGVHSFVFMVPYSDEFHREMFMNALLYYPFGLTLSMLVGPWSVLAAFVLSLVIEIWQYIAGTGLAQGTDVIMNTLGSAVGMIPYLIVRIRCRAEGRGE